MTGKDRPDDPLGAMRRFARSSHESRGEPDPFLCRHLRTRAWYGAEKPAADERDRPASPGPYVCLRTMRPAGPDGALALPEDCIDERVCFEPATRAGADS